jgi:hypothetical protein
MAKRDKSNDRNEGRAVLGRRAFTAISAVEGLKLTREGKDRIEAPISVEHRRAEVLRAYAEVKKRK